MTNPMTAKAARLEADRFEKKITRTEPNSLLWQVLTREIATLRAYADMLDGRAVDREALREKVDVLVCEAASSGWNDQAFGYNEGVIERVTDAILALMPASDISPPAMSESGAVSTNNPNVAHMKHAKDGEVERLVKETPRGEFTKDDLAGYPDNGTKINGRPDDPFNDQCSLDDMLKKYPDRMTRPDGSKQGDRDE